jgi:hypothetical protein
LTDCLHKIIQALYLVVSEKYEEKLIEVKVLEKYFKESSKGISNDLCSNRKRCDCDRKAFFNYCACYHYKNV